MVATRHSHFDIIFLRNNSKRRSSSFFYLFKKTSLNFAKPLCYVGEPCRAPRRGHLHEHPDHLAGEEV